MFDKKIVDSEYRLWPYTFELYLILSYKVTPRYSGIFNDLSRQIFNTIQVLNLYDDPESKIVGEVKMSTPEFEEVTKPLMDIFTLFSEDGAFVAELKYRPSHKIMFNVLELMNVSAIALMWKVGHSDITNRKTINQIYETRSKEVSSKSTSDNTLNTIRQKFKHDVTKHFLDNKEEFINPYKASEERVFQANCRRMADSLGFNDFNRFDRYLRDCLYKNLPLISEGEYVIKDYYYSDLVD